MTSLPPFVSLDSLADLDFVARRYGVRPAVYLGIDLRTELAYHVDRLAAHAGIWLERRAQAEAEGQQPTTPTAPKPREPAATFSAKHGIRGTVPVSNAPIPAWLDALFPEGPIQKPPTA